MQYLYNYESDAVVRENDEGKCYLKALGNLKEREADEASKVAWGIPSFGYLNALTYITKEQYDSF